jgi:hypothetical protein
LVDLALAAPIRLDQVVGDLKLGGPYAAGTDQDGFQYVLRLICRNLHHETVVGPLGGGRSGGG